MSRPAHADPHPDITQAQDALLEAQPSWPKVDQVPAPEPLDALEMVLDFFEILRWLDDGGA